MATAVVAESRYDPHCDTVEALDARLVALTRGGAPLRRALARIAGVFAEQRAWEPLGFVRLADYARERPGLSGRELHEFAHVDAALAKLPAIETALSSGQLGWTKARLLCRVATPESEARWLAEAGRLSAAALSREVRAIDVGALESGGVEPGEDEPHDRAVLRVRVAPRVKTKWGDVKRTLRRVTGEWLPTEACAELVAAEALSALGREVDLAQPAPLARRVRTAAAEVEPAPLPELPPTPPATISPFVEALVAGLEGADARELDAMLCRAAALERGLLARIGPLLLALAGLRGPFQLGFRSLDAYARERLGMSPRKARALLRLERACALAPVLARAWREGRITVSQAHALLPLFLAPGSEAFHAAWIQRAAEVMVRRLEDDVEHALATGAFDPARLPEAGVWDPEALDDPLDSLPEGVQTGAQHTARPETDLWVANVPADIGRLFRACLCSVARRLGASPAGRSRRCSTTRSRADHVLFRSAGGSDDLANLTTLCAAHHQRCVHGGVIRIAGRAPGALVFEMPLGRYRSGDRAVSC